jgi:hypothetical protein
MDKHIIISRSYDMALFDNTKFSWLVMAPKWGRVDNDSPYYETQYITHTIREAVDKAKELVARSEELHDALLLFSLTEQPDVNLVDPNDDITLIQIVLANS